MLRTAAAIVLAATPIAACSPGQNKHQAIIEIAWKMDAEYQRTTRANLEDDLVAEVVEQSEGPCVIITSKPGYGVMGGDSTSCFAGESSAIRWMDRPTN
jgi:L-lactate utilization protein LutC